jgi:hypothetical protein
MWRCSLAVNQNAFNSRITSEALEERFRQVFPAQAGSELIQDLYASGVIVPTIDFTAVAEGSFLPEQLQQAVNLGGITAFNHSAIAGTLFTQTGFWLIQGNVSGFENLVATLGVTNGITTKIFLNYQTAVPASSGLGENQAFKFIVYLNAGESVTYASPTNCRLTGYYRQVADINGNLVNPVGFTF